MGVFSQGNVKWDIGLTATEIQGVSGIGDGSAETATSECVQDVALLKTSASRPQGDRFTLVSLSWTRPHKLGFERVGLLSEQSISNSFSVIHLGKSISEMLCMRMKCIRRCFVLWNSGCNE